MHITTAMTKFTAVATVLLSSITMPETNAFVINNKHRVRGEYTSLDYTSTTSYLDAMSESPPTPSTPPPSISSSVSYLESLNAVNEVCDADVLSEECADAIADYASAASGVSSFATANEAATGASGNTVNDSDLAYANAYAEYMDATSGVSSSVITNGATNGAATRAGSSGNTYNTNSVEYADSMESASGVSSSVIGTGATMGASGNMDNENIDSYADAYAQYMGGASGMSSSVTTNGAATVSVIGTSDNAYNTDSVQYSDVISDYMGAASGISSSVAANGAPNGAWGNTDNENLLQDTASNKIDDRQQQNHEIGTAEPLLSVGSIDSSQQTQAQIQQQDQRLVSDEEALLVDEQLTEKEIEEKFLKMVSTEIGVKNLNNQNPYAVTDIPVDVLIGRILDTLEDDAQKNNGKFKGQARLKLQKEPSQDRPTVVVLGTGWGAHAFIKAASTYDLRIVVVSPVNHFVFTPMLASAAVGTVEYRSMTEPIRVTNNYIDNFVEGRAIGVDVDNKKVQVQLTSLSTFTGTFRGVASSAPCRLEPESDQIDASSASRVIDLNYDYLLCAVGTSVRSSIVPGAKEYCFNLKTSQDSKRLRTAIGEAMEYASRPDVQESYYMDPQTQMEAREERRRRLRFVIVGGGPTGVELAGELSDFFSQVCSKPEGAYQHLADDISILLVHGGSELLPQMDRDLRQLAYAALQLQGVEVRLNTRLKEVSQEYVKVGLKGSDEIETIPSGLTVWAAGNAPVPFVKELLSQLPESAAGSAGRINVDQWLRCPTHTPETFGSILVLGDVACLEAEHKYGPVEALPQTAQVAGQQGAFAARMLNRKYDLRKTPPKLPETHPSDSFSLLRVWLVARGLEEAPEFKFLSLGLLAYIGGGEALNQVQLGDVPIFNYAGKVAFALWRSVYLSKQAATRNQALIAFDWLRTETFGRDITRL